VSEFIPGLIVLVLIAALVRDDTVLTLCYFLGAVYFLGHWWSRRAFKSVIYKRTFTTHAFPNEKVAVQLELTNPSWLPVVWLSIFDSAVPEISPDKSFRQVFSLGPHGNRRFQYQLLTYKRGYYPVGPLFLQSGDLFGLSSESFSQGTADHLTVYPHIVPLSNLRLPSRSPLGTLRHTQPIFEDPTRVIGKRNYTTGDSLRRVDWKASAAAGHLQVKQYEPSIALETALILDLGESGYDRRQRYDATELAIVVAASVASYIVNQRQAVGLITNAKDAANAPVRSEGGHPLSESPIQPGEGWGGDQVIPVRKGRAHLIRVLEVLARAQINEKAQSLTQLLQTHSVHLAWGTTLIVVTGQPNDADTLFDALFHARRSGLTVLLIFVNPFAEFNSFRARAERFGFTAYQILREKDLDVWRGL
jgi:uncharacterized protein (DUF58 family)